MDHVLIITEDSCVNCGVCKEWCMAQAIKQKATCCEIIEEKCTKCDRCWDKCPANCIEIFYILH